MILHTAWIWDSSRILFRQWKLNSETEAICRPACQIFITFPGKRKEKAKAKASFDFISEIFSGVLEQNRNSDRHKILLLKQNGWWHHHLNVGILCKHCLQLLCKQKELVSEALTLSQSNALLASLSAFYLQAFLQTYLCMKNTPLNLSARQAPLPLFPIIIYIT